MRLRDGAQFHVPQTTGKTCRDIAASGLLRSGDAASSAERLLDMRKACFRRGGEAG